ncbi:tetratricopeptide repeat-containing glycosyltransferase family 2 protein [Paenibacillus graminis]|uniref:tetratricopeptide repeat-containing glycosyltransferase family 2 protein n=1 Tax=Paenibacillus graminis TaxID=189425 RepID=UPI002DBD34CA|nr:glycosyltransferase [Paenibacillus graminis]MEC0172693.1 glycosyltransferase [Paenibacillus graminis]
MKPRNRISLCMIVKNEADNLPQCLKSVRGVADEIIVVDTGSTDSSVQIARSYGARIVDFPWNGDFAAARNAGLKVARGQWILVLDADEELDQGSAGELLLCAEHMEYEAFFLRIHNHKGTSCSSETITVNPILRMFRNRPAYRFSGIIHEQIASVIVRETPAAAMHLSTVVIHHYGYADGVVAKKDKIRRNVDLLKEQLKHSPGDAFHHFNMAVEYMRLGEYDHALEHIHISLEHVEPDTSYVHLLHKYEIRCLAVKGDVQGALAACERGIALFPDYADLYHIKGVLLLQAAAWIEAKEALRQALEIGVSPPGYHTESGFGTYATLSLLGQLCQEIGEDYEAAAFYTKAARLHPEPWPLIARLVRALKCSGRESELNGWLELHVPSAAAEYRKLAVLLLNEGCYRAAAERLAKSGCNDAFEPLEQRGQSASEMDSDSAGDSDGVAKGEPVNESGAPAAHGSAGSSGTAPEDSGSFIIALQKTAAAPAASLSREEIAMLLERSCRISGQGTGLMSNPAYQNSRSWILLADSVLASLPASAASFPAAGKVRQLLPLPRMTD